MNSPMALSRRGLLQAGLLGSATIWAGGQVGCARRRVAPAVVTHRLALVPPGEEIIRAVMPAVLGPLLPASGAAREEALDAGVASLDDYLAHLSLPLQEEARSVFDTLDLLPVRVLLVGTWGRWHEVPPDTVEAFLRAARDSRFHLLRRMFAFLQSLAVLAWFDQPVAWPAIGYSGPPIERPAVSGDDA
jgi:hypothetical protein